MTIKQPPPSPLPPNTNQAHPQRAADALDDLDGVQVAGAAEAHDGVHRQLRKVVLVGGQDLAAQRGLGDVDQVRAESLRVGAVVERDALQPAARGLGRLAIAGDDRGRVDLLADQLLRLTQQLPGQHHDRRRPVAHLVVLGLGNVCVQEARAEA